MRTPLADAFLERSAVAAGGDRDALERRLAQLVEGAGADLPGVAVDALGLAATLASAPGAAEDALPARELVRDAALALACAAGDPVALRLFDALVRGVVPAALASMKLSAERVDEVAQRVRERLLVPPPGEAPRIVRYAARGALRGLVTVVATRLAIETTRTDQRAGARASDDATLLDRADGPELALVKAEYRAAFREAFRGAVAALAPRDKNLLRLHLVGGVTLAELATMYGQHRATIVRQLAHIRAELLASTRKSLERSLRIAPRELESLWGLVESRLDVSVMSLLEGD